MRPAQRMLTLDTACSLDLIDRALGPDGFGLPVHLIRDKVLPFFLCHRVTNFSCSWPSSSQGDFPLSARHKLDDQQWWISGQDNFKLGSGREWLEFKLGDGSAVRRVSAIGVKIPPLPFGPLSVRQFHVEYKAVDGTWMRHLEFSRRWTTLRCSGLLSFHPLIRTASAWYARSARSGSSFKCWRMMSKTMMTRPT